MTWWLLEVCRNWREQVLFSNGKSEFEDAASKLTWR